MGTLLPWEFTATGLHIGHGILDIHPHVRQSGLVSQVVAVSAVVPEGCFWTLHLLFNMAARRVQIHLTCTAFSSHFVLKKSFLLSAEASIIEGQMTGIIKASGGIPAERFGVSTKDFANPSLINLFKHLCILSSVQLTPGYLFPFRCLPTVPVFACS